MIPVKLTIQGLFSYQEKQTIDFRRLTEAHLFGIFGAVGSGKSTILDAITYALYGETERMNARENRNYNMMNLKSDELFIEFDFSAGKENATYRSVVRGKRNRKRFDDVKTLERTAYRNIDGVWEPLQIEELPSIIGLSYENFKRTIIIPQGKFQEFIQLGNKDRTQMMKELFNLEKFELYYKTVALETKNSEQMQKLQGQLQQLGEVKPEQLAQARLRLDAIAHEIKLLSEQLLSKQREENALTQLKELVGRLAEQQLKFDFLKSGEGEVLKSEQLVKEYEHCYINFKNLFDRKDEIEKSVVQLNSVISSEESLLKESITQLSLLENDFIKIKDDYDHRDLLKQQADELRKIIRIIELNDENKKLVERIKKGEEICAGSVAKVQKNKTLQDGLVEKLKTLKSNLPDLAELSKVQNWFTIQKSLTASTLEHSKELDAIQLEIKILNDRFIRNTVRLFEGTQHPQIGEVLELLSQKVIKTKESIAATDQNIEHLLIRTKLEEYAASLEDGKPCPLCGSLHHPEILDGGNMKMALQKERDSKLKQEHAVESIEMLIVDLRQIETQLHLKQESIQKLKSKLAENQSVVAAHQALFVWPGYRDEQVLKKAFSDADTMQLAIKSADDQLAKLQKESDSEQKDLEKYNIELDKIRKQQIINQAEMDTLTFQIEKLDPQAYIQQPTEQVKRLLNSLLVKYSEAESAYVKTSGAIKIVQQKRDESSGKLQANRIILAQEQKLQIEILGQINHRLSASVYSSVDQIKEILNKKIDLETEKQKNQDFRQQLQLSVDQIGILKTGIGERVYDADIHQKLHEDVLKHVEILADRHQELGKTQGEVSKMVNDLNQQRDIRKSLDDFGLRADNLKTMKQLFKGSGFVNYVSSVHLQNLCLAANERFYKLVRQKMSLEITEDNNFLIRDFLNGGKVRSIKTLSGGQTFQAALSMALALADSIQHFTNPSQNFFFLDEGFGSLDKESLEVVFETLKSLRKENRIVGVISHVEEMQQEIDTHLRIINGEENGSRVFESWKK